MTLKEKIEHENPNQIHLYREGMFWKAYNQSAFHFFRLIKPYLVKKRYVKELKTEIVSMGFPHSILDDMLERLESVSVSTEKGEKEICICLQAPQTGYEEWFQQFEVEEKSDSPNRVGSPVPEPDIHITKGIIQALRDFPIMQKTPLEVQLFVLQLQEQLKTARVKN